MLSTTIKIPKKYKQDEFVVERVFMIIIVWCWNNDWKNI